MDRNYTAQSAMAFLADLVGQLKGMESPASNTGTEFENEVFSIHAYCWCDGNKAGHEDDCPPCFDYKMGGFWADWYKHVNRDFECAEISPEGLREIMVKCLESLR